MALGREASLGVGLACAALVWGVYNVALPTVADVRVGEPEDSDAGAAERTATWASAAAVSAVSLIAKDATVFILGGSMVVLMSLWYRHANFFNVSAGGAMLPQARMPVNADSTQQPDAGYSPAV